MKVSPPVASEILLALILPGTGLVWVVRGEDFDCKGVVVVFGWFSGVVVVAGPFDIILEIMLDHFQISDFLNFVREIVVHYEWG